MMVQRGSPAMSTFLWIGTGLGAIVGLLHAGYLSRGVAVRGAGPRALYYGAWTLALWTLFGAYVLAFWCLGAFGLAVARLLGRRGAPRIERNAR
jgi:hypothetical protein